MKINWLISEEENTSRQQILDWQKELESLLASNAKENSLDILGRVTISIKNNLPLLRDFEGRTLQIDFENNKGDYHRRILKGKSELLAKAIGVGKGHKQVLDLTCGLGIDAFFLLKMDCEVLSLERSPILFFLLTQGHKLLHSELRDRWEIIHTDACTLLKLQLTELEKSGQLRFNSIYYDPMYPHKSKSALPRQEMVVFRNIVGADEDAGQVMSLALDLRKAAQKKNRPLRIIVKRPIDASPLAPFPTHQFQGKSVRFDLY